MQNDLKAHISEILNEEISRVSALQGGDISSAYKLKTAKGSYFLKANNAPNALSMFKAEAKGLQKIQLSNSVKTPEVLACGLFKNTAFLLLEFIESKQPSAKDFENLGLQLAQMHQCTTNEFGLDSDNFIGLLPQSNQTHSCWTDFYIKERLLPQLKLAQSKNLLLLAEIPSEVQLYDTLSALFKNIKPALLHGDLWSGNYIISTNGTPYLIDPAIYFGHSEVDLAMTKLFGGFGSSFYEAYTEIIPFKEQSSARMAIYQLYYLLVHLNMFGSSYHSSVMDIIKRLF